MNVYSVIQYTPICTSAHRGVELITSNDWGEGRIAKKTDPWLCHAIDSEGRAIPHSASFWCEFSIQKPISEFIGRLEEDKHLQRFSINRSCVLAVFPTEIKPTSSGPSDTYKSISVHLKSVYGVDEVVDDDCGRASSWFSVTEWTYENQNPVLIDSSYELASH